MSNLPRKAVAPTLPIPENYQKPVTDKPEEIRELISRAARDNLLFRSCTVR
jgi:hypothetical protein